ncbi:hypothetical protein B0T13DRAFT_91112 [Neurospora crassa]|nr:hypothetical protein B0T13DRAFT_91112 [Neurospora crassa]
MTVTLSTRLCMTLVSIFLSSGHPIRVVSDAGIELDVKWDGGSGLVTVTAIRENPREGGDGMIIFTPLSCGGVTFSRSVPDSPDSPDGAGEGRSHPSSCPPTPVVIPPYLPTCALRRLVVVIAGSFVRFRRDYQWRPYWRYGQRDRPD